MLHWPVALGFFVAYFTEDNIDVHIWAGYVVGMLVLQRIAWGFVGPEHAHFSDFLFSPFRMLSYTAGLLTLKAGQRYIGHSPAGAAMIFALLLGLLATVGSGLALYAVDENSGPLAGVVGTSTGPSDAMRDAEDGDDPMVVAMQPQRSIGKRSARSSPTSFSAWPCCISQACCSRASSTKRTSPEA